ncbi:thioredoxin family protein [Roseateles toxinivorans]|uniref:Thioredoxin n=1 Tax=Roseateles toxinivorans TaxID=270368 RepID=A0A4R6QNS7_9BURK|nr:thioredoxin family protein [Roseateles toxinivorans]TDP72646.1 thioredoxin [Roseateles toxinivorans]
MSTAPLIVCLCAAWCRTCDGYRATFDAVAQQFPDWRFVWVDIEEQSALVDDYEVETFPCLLAGQGTALQFAGPVTPHAPTLTRLLASLGGNPSAAVKDAAAQQLWQRLRPASD